MSLSNRLSFVMVVVLVGGCSKTVNPEVCCTDPTDCTSIGAEEDNRPCPTALACVDHECVVPDCSMQGCPAAEPVCNLTSNACEGCDDNTDCANFRDQQRCLIDTGACVQCLTSTDCGPTVPICKANTCTKCERDSECATGACGNDGMCTDEGSIVYLDPAGTDAGTCTRSMPCRSLAFAVTQTSNTRNHIVMALGGYVANLQVSPTNTPATSLVVHGGGATLSSQPGVDGTTLQANLPMEIRSLDLNSTGGTALSSGTGVPVLVRDSTITAAVRGISAGLLTLRQVTIEGAGSAGILIAGGGTLEIDGVVIRGGWTEGIVGASQAGATVDIVNLVVSGTTDLAVDLPFAAGSVAFSTIADSGTDSGNGPRAFRCSNALTVRSSIIWAPGTTARVPLEGCNVATTIAGPTPVPGALNVDPQFADSTYHLRATSPARDAVDIGPATDFEGDPRPTGVRFDIGADE